MREYFPGLLRPAAMLPDVAVIGVYCGSLGSARIFERQGKFKRAFLPTLRALIFVVAGEHVRDSLCQRLCESGSPSTAFLPRKAIDSGLSGCIAHRARPGEEGPVLFVPFHCETLIAVSLGHTQTNNQENTGRSSTCSKPKG